MTKHEKDQLRWQILRHLHHRHDHATSVYGKGGAATKIGDLRRKMKEEHNQTREQVVSNLLYLIDQGWVSKEEQSRLVPNAAGRTVPSVTTFYQITASGVDRIDGEGEFTIRDRFSGIQVGSQSVVVVGDGNQVRSEYASEANSLAALSAAIKASAEMTSTQKMDAVADIDAIQWQLSRSKPNADVIRSIWSTISCLPKITSLAGAVANAARQMQPLTGQI